MGDRIILPADDQAQLRALLAEHVPHAEVWAYGSRIKGTAHEGSDLDLVLRNPADLSVSVTGLSGLIEGLQTSTLPILVEVHDWAHLPAAFQEEIQREHVVLQSAVIC